MTKVEDLIPWHFESTDKVVGREFEKELGKLSPEERQYEVENVDYSLEKRVIYVKVPHD